MGMQNICLTSNKSKKNRGFCNPINSLNDKNKAVLSMRFGILCNGTHFQMWQFETIRHLISGGHTCSLLIMNANPVQHSGFIGKIRNYPYSKLLYRIWFRYMMKPNAKKEIDISEFYQDIPAISCITSKKGYAAYFNEKDVHFIQSAKLDFILRFGFGIIKGEILEAAKYGIWSYHHDDDRKYRGVPTGFWEIMFDDPVNAAILQRLTDQLDSGIILRKAFFSTINHSWQANLDNLLKSSTEWPLQVCTDIENGNSDFLSVKNSPGTAIYKLPGNAKMFRFLLKVATQKIKFHFRDLFLTEKWNIGIIPVGVDKFLCTGEFSIPEPVWLNINRKKSVYHADSFGFVKEGKYHVICEEYDYKTAKGLLISLQIDKESFRILKKTPALEKPYHLAFPYLFEYEGDSYCLPESSEGGNLDLYRYDTGTGKLIFEQTLVENLQAVDPTLFFHNKYWWLFFTDKVSTNERLHIWYSDSMRGPFSPHANNPVKVDIRSSRPAGIPFVLNGKLFRPAQDCTIRSGRRICINEVITLSETAFIEKEHTLLNTAPGSGFTDGMHTFCVSDRAVIVDGKRECFIWAAFVRKLKRKFSKIFN